MRIRSALYLAMILVLLAACGRPDAISIASSTQPAAAPQAAGDDIAKLLQNPPAAGTSFELDAYTWRVWIEMAGDGGSSSINHDTQGCPIWNSATALLTDRPTPWMLPILDEWSWNVGPDYPPDSATWLVMDGNIRPPYHARIRGHISDASVAKCSFAKHIFTFEQVVETYEQRPPDVEIQAPDTFSSWKRYHDADLGYSFLYPPGWSVEKVDGSGLVAELAVRDPQNPDYPMLIRIHSGETYYDQSDIAHIPPLLQAWEGLPQLFEQDNIRFKGTVDHHHLVGYHTTHFLPDHLSQQTGVFFNSSGRTYELLVHYPIGLDASQDLTTTYTFFVLSFQFDLPPGPTPTPPIKQQLGTGPFLSQEQVLALVRQKYGAEATLLKSTLVSEVEARKTFKNCNDFQGHPEGVWLLTIHGIAEEMRSTIQLDLDASTGAELCAEIAPDPGEHTPPARPVYTPMPGTTSTPFSDSYTPVPAMASPYPAP